VERKETGALLLVAVAVIRTGKVRDVGVRVADVLRTVHVSMPSVWPATWHPVFASENPSAYRDLEGLPENRSVIRRADDFRRADG